MITYKTLLTRIFLLCMVSMNGASTLEGFDGFSSVSRWFNRTFSWSTESHMRTAQHSIDQARYFTFDVEGARFVGGSELTLLAYTHEVMERRVDAQLGGLSVAYAYHDQLRSCVRALENSEYALRKRLRSIYDGSYPIKSNDPLYHEVARVLLEVEEVSKSLRVLIDLWGRYGEFLTVAQEVYRLNNWRVPLYNITAHTIGTYVYANCGRDKYPYIAYDRYCADTLAHLDKLENKLDRQTLSAPLLHGNIAELRNSIGTLRACACAHPSYATETKALQHEKDRQSESRQRELDRENEARQRELDRQHEARQRELDRHNEARQRELDRANYV